MKYRHEPFRTLYRIRKLIERERKQASPEKLGLLDRADSVLNGLENAFDHRDTTSDAELARLYILLVTILGELGLYGQLALNPVT